MKVIADYGKFRVFLRHHISIAQVRAIGTFKESLGIPAWKACAGNQALIL
jgi:hypothetical protein